MKDFMYGCFYVDIVCALILGKCHKVTWKSSESCRLQEELHCMTFSFSSHLMNVICIAFLWKMLDGSIKQLSEWAHALTTKYDWWKGVSFSYGQELEKDFTIIIIASLHMQNMYLRRNWIHSFSCIIHILYIFIYSYIHLLPNWRSQILLVEFD